MKKILIIGGTSFLGYHFKNYARNNYKITSTYLTSKPDENNFVRCNVLSNADLYSLNKFDVVMHYSSIISGKDKIKKNLYMVKNILNYCNKNSSKYIYLSSSQVNFKVNSEYKQSKIESEKLIQQKSNDYVIVRPAAPYGEKLNLLLTRNQSFHILADLISKMPFIPIIGNGKYLRQPVNIHNLNELLVNCIESNVKNVVFEIGGPEQLSFNEIVDTIVKSKQKKFRIKIHLPKFIFIFASQFFKFIDKDLVNAVTSDEFADNKTWEEYFPDIKLIPFKQGVNIL